MRWAGSRASLNPPAHEFHRRVKGKRRRVVPVTEPAAKPAKKRKKFQEREDITVDGIIGAQTWSFLTYWANSPNYVC